MADMIQQIFEIFAQHGDEEYLGEPVTMAQHAAIRPFRRRGGEGRQ